MKQKKYIVIDKGENLCKKCCCPMQRRTHREITKKILKQPYYFSEWDVCPDCGMVQLYEEFKVILDRERVNLIKESYERYKMFDNL